MLALNRMGEAVEVTELSPYDQSSVDREIPDADFITMPPEFSQMTFDTQAYNDMLAQQSANVQDYAKFMRMQQMLRNADVLEAYRMKIACDQANSEINVENDLLNQAIEQNINGPDFNRLEISNIVHRNGPFPSMDWETMVPGDRIDKTGTNPDSWTSRHDASNTNREGQMSGYWGNTNLGVARPRGGINGFGACDWNDFTCQIEAQIPNVIPQLVGGLIPKPPTPTAPASGGTTVIPTGVKTSTTTSTSSVNMKYLVYGGAILGGLVLLTIMASAVRR